MPQQPRRLETRRMAEMTQGVEDIRACTGGDRIKVPCWNRGRKYCNDSLPEAGAREVRLNCGTFWRP
jgi:hypothetical protein